jgi:hypothetical protein
MTLDCKEWRDNHQGSPDMLDRVERAYPARFAAIEFNKIIAET